MKKERKNSISANEVEDISAIPGDTVAGRETGGGVSEALCRLRGRVGRAVGVLRGREVRESLFRVVLPTVYTALCARVPAFAGLYPFGISAVAATVGGLPSLLAAAGAAASSLLVRGGAYTALFSALTAAVLTLYLRGQREGGDTLPFRAGLALVMGVLQTVAVALFGGISFYEACGVAVAAVLFPMLSLSLAGIFTGTGRTEVGVLGLIWTLGFMLCGGGSPGGLATVLFFGASVAVSYRYGVLRGVGVGLVLGLASPAEYGLIWPVGALTAGVLGRVSPGAATAAAALASVAYGVYSAGGEAVGALLPELLLCTAVLGPLFGFGVIKRREEAAAEGLLSLGDTVAAAESGESFRLRLRRLSAAMANLSSSLSRMGAQLRRPDRFEAREICRRAAEGYCAACGERERCWEREYSDTVRGLNELAAAVQRGETPTLSHLTPGMRDRCAVAASIVERCAADSLSYSGRRDVPTAVAESYASVSRFLSDMGEEFAAEVARDGAASDLLTARLRSMGAGEAEAAVFGEERRRVVITGLERGCAVSGEEIRLAAADVLGASVSVPEYRIDGRRIIASLHSEPRFSFSVGRASVSRRGERCGDSVVAFVGEGGYFYTLISDGMGSGGLAAMSSGTVAVFLERLLSAGASTESALDMLNSFLISRSCECFATVDLMEADSVTGEARFIKSGAAPSFVLRGGRLFRLASRTVPVGIISPYDAEKLTFTLCDGDVVVMLSDGAVPDGEGESFLLELLAGEDSPIFEGCDPDGAAAAVAEAVAEHTDRGDDVSVALFFAVKRAKR